MGVVALSLATIGCGSEQKTQSKETTPAAVRNINLKKYTVAEDAELDTLSYTVGATSVCRCASASPTSTSTTTSTSST